MIIQYTYHIYKLVKTAQHPDKLFVTPHDDPYARPNAFVNKLKRQDLGYAAHAGHFRNPELDNDTVKN